MKKKRFTVYSRPGVTVQLRDSRKLCDRGEQGIVAVFPTVGCGYTTWQDHDQAVRLARRIVKLLNA
jgi:hypothetical protein